MLSLTLMRQSIRSCSSSIASIAVAQKIVIIRQVTGEGTFEQLYLCLNITIINLNFNRFKNHPSQTNPQRFLNQRPLKSPF